MPPMVGGGTEAMDLQQCRATGMVLIRVLLNCMHGMAEMGPGDAIHSQQRGTRC